MKKYFLLFFIVFLNSIFAFTSVVEHLKINASLIEQIIFFLLMFMILISSLTILNSLYSGKGLYTHTILLLTLIITTNLLFSNSNKPIQNLFNSMNNDFIVVDAPKEKNILEKYKDMKVEEVDKNLNKNNSFFSTEMLTKILFVIFILVLVVLILRYYSKKICKYFEIKKSIEPIKQKMLEQLISISKENTENKNKLDELLYQIDFDAKINQILLDESKLAKFIINYINPYKEKIESNIKVIQDIKDKITIKSIQTEETLLQYSIDVISNIIETQIKEINDFINGQFVLDFRNDINNRQNEVESMNKNKTIFEPTKTNVDANKIENKELGNYLKNYFIE